MCTPGILNKKEDGSFEYQIINEWQLCPKCNGEGKIVGCSTTLLKEDGSKEIIETTYPCDLCNGKKIISKVNGLPPNDQTI